MKIIVHGLLTGLFLQLAIGPIFLMILRIAFEADFLTGMAGVTAVTLVDYIYITLSIVGIAQVLSNPKIKRLFGLISASVIMIFGIFLLIGALKLQDTAHDHRAWTVGSAFATCFALTISSPLTLFFWSSIFTAKAIEKGYNKRQIAIFGIGAGMATFLFLGATVFALSVFNTVIPSQIVKVLNIFVAIVMLLYGVLRFIRCLRPENDSVETLGEAQ